MDREENKTNVGLGVMIPSPATLPSISPLVNSVLLSPNAPSSVAMPQSLNTPSITPNTAAPSSAGGFGKHAEAVSRLALQPLNVTPSNFSISPSVASGYTNFDSSLRGFVPTPDYTPNTLLDRAQALAVPLEQYKIKSPSEIEKLTEEELRNALVNAQGHVRTLEQELMKTRTASSHSALQHAMLVVGFENERDRFEVEKTMAKREVEVLRRNQESGGGVYQQNKLNELRVDNDVLRNRLKRAKQVIITEREKVNTLTKDNERLKKRIKDNRAHNNMAERAMITAEAEAGRRRQLGQSAHRSTRSNVEDGLAALGQVASQALAEQRDEEARGTAVNSPLHTPARHTPARHTPALERFGSSMQTPPSQQLSQQSQHPHLMSPVALSPARYSNWTSTLTPGKKHQRARDDTISASEGENAGNSKTGKSKPRPGQSAGAPPAKRQRTGTTPKTPRPRAKPTKQPASASGPKTGVLDLSAKKRKQASTAPSTPVPEPRERLQYSPRPDITDRSRLDEQRRAGFQ